MDLFAALEYAGLENRTSMLLLAVLRHLSDAARAALLQDVVPANLGSTHEIHGQHTISAGVLDGWLRWSGHCVVLMEAKVDDPLGSEQPNRYAAWLSTQMEPHRVLWLVTRDLPEVAELLPTLNIPDGVKRVWTSWTQLAERAATLAPAAADVDRLLLVALTQRLRATGIAVTPHLPIDGAALGLALGTFPHIRRLREHLVDWFRSLSWLPGSWTHETRYQTWVDLSVCAHRELKLAKPDVDGKDRCITWWAEVYAPADGECVWPPEQSVGMALRLGVIVEGAAAAEIALDSVRAALGAPSAIGRPDFRPANGYHPWIFDARNYHEVWWHVEVDPTDFASSAKRLRLAIEEQGQRLGRLVEGSSPQSPSTDER
jgi:hypothetical protein